MMRGDIAIELGPARFKNPVFLASGPAGYGTEYEGLIDLQRIGGIVTKTITLEPRAGNPGPRLWETPGGLLNSVGLENVGAERFFEEKLPALEERGVGVIVSLAAEGWDDYAGLLEVTAAEDVDVVEINLSCPNVESGGMAVGTDPDLVARYIDLARKKLPGRAIIAKLTPNVTDIAALAHSAEKAGADAVTAINTVIGMDLEKEDSRPVFNRVSAGLSGPAILPVALDAVWRITRAVDLPVFGVGGISSVGDAHKFFAAGAFALQIGTAIFYDHKLPECIVEALEQGGLPPRGR